MRLKEVENLIKGLEKGDIIFLKDKLVYTGLERYYRINQSTRELEYTDFDLKNNISKAKWKKSLLTVSELLAAGNFNIIEGR